MALPLPPPDSAKTTAGMRPDLRYHKTYLPCIPAAAAHEATTTGSTTETPVSSTTETPVYSSTTETPVYSSTTETPFSSATETPVYSSTTENPVYSSATETPVYSSARVSVSPRRVITAIAKRRSPTISFLEKREQEVLSSSDTETQDKQRQRRESVGSELMDRRTIQFQSIT